MAHLEVFLGLLLPTLHILGAEPRQWRKAIGISAKFAANLPLHPHRRNVDQLAGPSSTEPSGTPPSIGIAWRSPVAVIGWPTLAVTITGVFEGTRS